MHDQRVFFSDNGTLSDLSKNLNDFRSGTETVNYTVSQDYIFIGSFLPFNHKHIDISTANDVASVVSVDIWSGSAWNAAVDVIDRTSVSGVSLAQDGIISWSTDIEETWGRQQLSSSVTGLTGTNIYNMYWVRLSFSATLKTTTALSFIGQKFHTDTDLYSFYPDLNNSSLKSSFASGKTDWNDQAYIAAENIVRDLKKDEKLVSSDQILDFDLFKETSCHAAAMIIYWGLGHFEKHDKVKSKYDANFKQGFLRLDLNQDANLEPVERVISGAKYLTR